MYVFLTLVISLPPSVLHTLTLVVPYVRPYSFFGSLRPTIGEGRGKLLLDVSPEETIDYVSLQYIIIYMISCT